MSISVALATYNGEQYIEEQLLSVLKCLSCDDEVIISDDNSTDNTREIVEKLALIDGRLKLIDGPCMGVSANFENAVKRTTKDYIFLCDQDDIWSPEKASKIISIFNEKQCDLVLHNANVLKDGKILNKTFFDIRKSRKGLYKNIIKNSYIGCCMAFKSTLKDKILPFPQSIPMHDQWIGIIAEKYGKVAFCDETLITYRRHSKNVSADSHSDILQMLKWRFNLIKSLNKRCRQINRGIHE